MFSLRFPCGNFIHKRHCMRFSPCNCHLQSLSPVDKPQNLGYSVDARGVAIRSAPRWITREVTELGKVGGYFSVLLRLCRESEKRIRLRFSPNEKGSRFPSCLSLQLTEGSSMPVFRRYHFITSPLFFQHPAPEHLPSKSAHVCAFPKKKSSRFSQLLQISLCCQFSNLLAAQ